MKIGETKKFVEIINEVASGKIKRDLILRYEYGLTYHFRIEDLTLVAYNGTGLYEGKVLNDKFTLERYYKKKEE